MRLKLQSKLLLPTLAAVILGMSVAAWLSFHFSQKALRETLRGQMAQAADMGSRQIHSWVDDLQKDLHGWSQNPTFAAALSSETGSDAQTLASTLLITAKKDYEFYELLAVADPQGNVVLSSNSEAVGTLNISERPYFRDALAGKANLSHVLRSKVSNRPVFVLAAPVQQGTVLGVVFAVVDLGKFTETFIAPIRIGTKGYAFVVGEDGAFLAHPDTSLILDTNVRTFSWGEPFLASSGGELTYDFRGEHKILYHQKEALTGWKVAVSATEEDIFAPIAQIRTMNLMAAALTILLVTLAVFIPVRAVTRTLRQGVEFAGAVRGGDISNRLHLTRDDELGELGKALDAMADGLAEKARVAEAIAGGDLSAEVRPASEKDVLGLALADMVASLNTLLGEVQATSEQIATGAAQVSDGSQSLSQGATESAASIEQMGSSLTQLASQTKTNAENAAQANQLTGIARQAAEKGNLQMAGMVQAMAEINEAGENISRIIKVIDEIAFQTNLLALNAAVEAARAGVHGKGFAVVAEEVRNLAARSARAARETADLIEKSVSRAENGARIADGTAQALAEIVQGVGKVSDLVAEIAAASTEQAQGLAQVNIGLGQIDQVTQQNTANAEESAAAAEELAGQADGLRRMLGRFRLRSQTDGGPAGRGARPPRPLTSPHGPENKSPSSAVIIALDDGEFGKF